MPSTEQMRNRLIDKLKELFQLNQPDLDFGFYRIMHAKSGQVLHFLQNDLLSIIANAFGQADDAKKAELKAAYEQAIEQAKKYDAPNPEETEPVKAAKAAYDHAKDIVSSEGEIYDHLFRFFERYYDDGDFISRRYYTRETAGKAAPFAVPYNGEEVKLHWANADQYYIKTTEYFSNFSINLSQAVQQLTEKQRKAKSIEEIDFDEISIPEGLKVQFRIITATEGEHGNVKASDNSRRYFILHAENPLEMGTNRELIIHFEYRPDPDKTGQEGTWKDFRNKQAVKIIFETLRQMPEAKEYLKLLSWKIPTDANKDRMLLEKYINQYTSRNTMDYFIHKDLGSFLRRELDFYIKNEIMRLDDIEQADAPQVQEYLDKIKVFRLIAGKLISFMAQLEDFQKKLWLKKKFIVETNYCITLDRVPESLYPEIIANQTQIEEWVKLHSINEIEGDTVTPAFTTPITLSFLKANPYLVLDTKFFTEGFKSKLLASIDNFDEQCDGLLINSENFQALNLLQDRYREQVKSEYIDPPYNTEASEIIYKNGFKNSSWASLMVDRIKVSYSLQTKDGGICATIDDYELNILKSILEENYGASNWLANVLIRSNPQGRSTVQGFSFTHEYAMFFRVSERMKTIGRLNRSDKQKKRYNEKDDNNRSLLWENFRKTGTDSLRRDRPKQFYPIIINKDQYRVPKMVWLSEEKTWQILEEILSPEVILYPIDERGNERVWKWGNDRVLKNPKEIKVVINNGIPQVYRINYINALGSLPNTWWDNAKYGAGSHGTNLLTNFFGIGHTFSFPKSIHAVEDCLRIISNNDNEAIHLDYFSGSGTTGHAVINLNKEDDGNRKYVLVEMGDYFDTVLKPRIQKVIYSDTWKDGKPVNRTSGISHCFKYLRLESYEDTLNNLELNPAIETNALMEANPALKQGYMLHYMLDTETQNSASLLNIDAFADPMDYKLKVKKPGTDEYYTTKVDLIETFNYLIGLRVEKIYSPTQMTAEFERLPDPELPEEQKTRLSIVKDSFRQSETGNWHFHMVEGWKPRDRYNPNNGEKDKVLIIWRNLTGDLEQDNLMLDTMFRKKSISTFDTEFDTIYINGSNNLPNLKQDDENWKVRLIEEDFFRLMWEE